MEPTSRREITCKNGSSRVVPSLEESVAEYAKDLALERLTQSCEESDLAIREAWHTLLDEIRHYKEEREELFVSLGRVIGEDRAHRYIESDLRHMVPETCKVIGQFTVEYRSLLDIRSTDPPPPAPNTAQALVAAGDKAIHVASADAAGKEELKGNSRAQTPATPSSAIRQLKRPASASAVSSPLATKKLKATSGPGGTKLNNGQIENSCDIEGKEYLFQYPEFGPGWFVIRCATGTERPLTFQDHPFEENRALNHFNGNMKDKCHPTDSLYTENDIFEKFGFRVLVDDEWAARSNNRLAIARSKMLSKAKSRNKIRPGGGRSEADAGQKQTVSDNGETH